MPVAIEFGDDPLRLGRPDERQDSVPLFVAHVQESEGEIFVGDAHQTILAIDGRNHAQKIQDPLMGSGTFHDLYIITMPNAPGVRSGDTRRGARPEACAWRLLLERRRLLSVSFPPFIAMFIP